MNLERSHAMDPIIEVATGRILPSLNLPSNKMLFCPEFFPRADADRLLCELLATTAWQQDSFKQSGRKIRIPRLPAWYGDEGITCTYWGIKTTLAPWTSPILEVKRAVEPTCGVTFNGVKLDRYRTHRDSISWHCDDEFDFEYDAVIASVSFGDTRLFQFRHWVGQDMKASVELTHGSLLIMRGRTREEWEHRFPRSKEAAGERVNLTFRVIDVPPR